MAYDKQLIAHKLRRWEVYLHEYRLPAWEDIPDFGIYMEQVIFLLKEYLDYLPPELKEEQFITASAINNYVRKKFMPEPIKKKYFRNHIAYLIMICSMKQSLSISTLQILIPRDLSNEELEKVYTSYVARHRMICEFFVRQVRSAAAGILDRAPDSELSTDSTEEIITAAAVVGGFSSLFAEKLLLLNNKSLDDFKDDFTEPKTDTEQ